MNGGNDHSAIVRNPAFFRPLRSQNQRLKNRKEHIMKCLSFATALSLILFGCSISVAQVSGVPSGALPIPKSDTNREIIQLLRQILQKLEAQSSPSARTVAAGTVRAGTVRLWDVVGGKELRAMTAATAAKKGVAAVAFSPDGKTLAVGDGTAVQLLDAATGKAVRKVAGMTEVVSVAFSPDGRLIAVGAGNAVRLFDVASGKEVRSIIVTTGPATVAFSASGRLLATPAAQEKAALDAARQRLSRAIVADELASAKAQVEQAKKRLEEAAAKLRHLEEAGRARPAWRVIEFKADTKPAAGQPAAGWKAIERKPQQMGKQRSEAEQRQEWEQRLERLMRELEELRRQLKK
jgi:hypothetical protein